jgi:hypothetical protein
VSGQRTGMSIPLQPAVATSPARCRAGLVDRPVVCKNPRLSLRRFEPNTCHHLQKRGLACGYRGLPPIRCSADPLSP